VQDAQAAHNDLYTATFKRVHSEVLNAQFIFLRFHFPLRLNIYVLFRFGKNVRSLKGETAMSKPGKSMLGVKGATVTIVNRGEDVV
jgi:hypothetical protein